MFLLVVIISIMAISLFIILTESAKHLFYPDEFRKPYFISGIITLCISAIGLGFYYNYNINSDAPIRTVTTKELELPGDSLNMFIVDSDLNSIYNSRWKEIENARVEHRHYDNNEIPDTLMIIFN